MPRIIVTHAFGTITGRTICRWARRHDVPFFLRCDSNENRELAKPRWQRIVRGRSFRWEMQLAFGALTIGASNEAFYARNGLNRERQFRVPFMIDSERVAGLAEQERATGDLRRKLGVQSTKVILFVGRLVDVAEAAARPAPGVPLSRDQRDGHDQQAAGQQHDLRRIEAAQQRP